MASDSPWARWGGDQVSNMLLLAPLCHTQIRLTELHTGIALFTVFGFMAGYSGYLIWHVFLGVDSYEFPARNYGKAVAFDSPCCWESFAKCTI